MSTVLFAYDCDSTIETSNGPVKLKTLRQLMAAGHYVFIVSPSPFCIREETKDIPHYSPIFQTRGGVLYALRKEIPATRYVYIGDLPSDLEAANFAGYEFCYAEDFDAWLRNFVWI